MKTSKALKMFLVITAALCFYSPSLFAQPLPEYYNISMTTEEGNPVAKPFPFYGWNEQPWLFLGLKKDIPYDEEVGISNTTSTWTWHNPSGTNISYIKSLEGTLNGLWTSLDTWGTIKQLGNWTIIANTTLFYTDGSSDYYTGNTSFKVVPEPASMILYILGGLSLASGFFRKKKS